MKKNRQKRNFEGQASDAVLNLILTFKEKTIFVFK